MSAPQAEVSDAAQATPARSVVVCGDLVWDTHIARLPFSPRGYFQPHLQSQLDNRHGGAWYLRDVIEAALGAAGTEAKQRVADRERDLEAARAARRQTDPPPSEELLENLQRAVEQARAWVPQFTVTLAAPTKVGHVEIEEGQIGGIAKAFSVWAWFEGKEKPARAKIGEGDAIEFKWREGKAQPGTWRITEFLGCQEPLWKHEKGYPVVDTPAAPYLLVIDDLGLGFAQHEECWPACLGDRALEPSNILVKATPPFDRPLWKKLLAPEWAARTTVVISASALRDYGARLSRGLSWDQTIREIRAEFEPGGVCWALRECACVVVPFGRSGAAVFSRTPRSPAEVTEVTKAPVTLQFERFVFDPAHLEDTWGADAPGTTFGAASAMAALLAVDALMSPRRSTHITVSRGLAAARALHEAGGGHSEKKLELGFAESRLFATDPKETPETVFRSAFPRDLLDPPQLSEPGQVPKLEDQTLLTDVVGMTPAFLSVAAEDIVRFGRERALAFVPRLQCGQYFTVDREEIERLNAVRNLILDYRDNKGDARPLSLAVFGPPGSGKSFAIKQLSEQIFGKERAVLEFNLSQFADLDDLHEAFHQVRDKSVAGQIPFVFWDEFDCQRDSVKLGWLKEFLAPMQDAQFVAKGKAHPFAKCVFIFAGGTKSTFAAFDRSADKADQEFRDSKGPDFVSRLRGYVNIKGPNPTRDTGDEAYLIRRALMLRLLIERHHPGIVQAAGKEVVISPTVLDAFLRVGGGTANMGYRHGARSMETLVSLSRLRGCRHFGPSELPPQEVAELHVTPDFWEKVADKSCYHLSPDDVDRIAAIIHQRWMERKRKQGYVYGPFRDDYSNPKTHPLMKPYEELSEIDKDANRLPARHTVLRLRALRYEIVAVDRADTNNVVSELGYDERRKLAISEHRRWMREKLLAGYTYDAYTNDELLRHRDVCRWKDLPDNEGRLDADIVDGIVDFLREKQLALVKQSEPQG